MINVQTFGGFSLWADGRVAHKGLGLSGRVLAAFLFVNQGQVFRREKLLGLFWGDLSEHRARRAMNTAVWRLRTILATAAGARRPNLLHSEAGEIMLLPSDAVDVDTRQLEFCVEQLWSRTHDPKPGFNETERQSLKASLARYQGPFLEDLDDEWVLQMRERMHCIYLRGLILLMADYAAVGYFEEALDFARRVLVADPLRERVQRHVMRLYVLNGQRAEATRQFNRCRSLLRKECGVDPMPQTVELHERIVSGEIFARLEAELCAVTSATRAPPLNEA